jgi:hypothetical protein
LLAARVLDRLSGVVDVGRRRLVVAAAIGVAPLLAACSSDAPAATATTSTTSTTSTVAPTTTSSTTTSTTSTTSTTLPPTTTTAPPTTTTFPIVVEGGIVLVANAAGVPGAGAKLTTALGDHGFVMKDPVNAAGAEEELDTSRIYYLAAARDVALSVAYLMGDIPILQMPTPPPIDGALDTLADANVLVMLGRDLAGKRLPDRG